MTRTPPKPYEPNAILGWLYRRFFSNIQVDTHWSDVVRESAQKGTVVYVMRSLSYLDFLCLDFLLKKFALPLVRFVNDLGLWILEPFGRGHRRLFFKRQIPEDESLRDALQDGFSALLFIRQPPGFARFRRRGKPLQTNLIQTLIDVQRSTEKPILLVPQTFVWTKRPPSIRPSLADLFFGPSEWPGKIRVFFQFFFNYRNALLRSGDPFDLKAFLEAHTDITDDRIADKIRYALLRRIERERMLVLGPTKKTPQRIREEILRSPRVRKYIESTARSENKSADSIKQEASRELIKLCAAPNPAVIQGFYYALRWVFRTAYDGLFIDEKGIDEVRQAARRGPVVFLPCHKSHADYLVLSQALYSSALNTPVIAAGDNLNFWPAGPILRRGGAFFIRRSFRGRKLYSALVEAYLRKLVAEGFNIEFFIEGGRSRTGKLLNPKLGLLSMIIDGALSAHVRELQIVPVSISYERVVEERSYVQEIIGGEKQKENFSRFVQFLPKFFKSSHGRVYVQFGKIFSIADLLPNQTKNLTPPQKRALVQKTAHRTVYEINRVTTVTPAALVSTVLLAHRRRGIPIRDVVEIGRALIQQLQRTDSRIGQGLLEADHSVRTQAIRDSLSLFLQNRMITMHGDDPNEAVCSVPDERRMALEYYKNNILHFFVPYALVVSAVLVTEGTKNTRADNLAERVLWLSKLLKYEFAFPTEVTFEKTFEDTLADMLATGCLVRTDDELHPAGGSRGALMYLYASMLVPYYESYRLALRGVRLFSEQPVSKKEWIKKTLGLGQKMYLSGELEQRESLSIPKLEGALLALADLKLVEWVGNDELKRSPQQDEAFEACERRLTAYAHA